MPLMKWATESGWTVEVRRERFVVRHFTGVTAICGHPDELERWFPLLELREVADDSEVG